ncbi:MAG TPA: PH domain-containing protein [Acidimicrobiia bacterium]|nr:PH domain-containing protein [Acidimicrobiia bacterium]
MPYPSRLLNEGEDVAVDLHPHWWFFVKQVVSGLALLVLFVLLLPREGTARDTVLWLVGAASLVWALWLVLQFLQWRFTYFVVTSERVIYRTGVLSRRGVEIPLERINNINFNQGILERLLGTGDLEIESAGEEGQSTFENVWHPDGVQQELYRQMKGLARERADWARSAPAPAPGASPSIAEQLEQLASLRDRGIISPAEFDAKKAQLLERM